MDLNLYKCCFCLNTVKNPLVMCHQTHVACFNCVCEHFRNESETNNTSICPVCRQPVHLRFDRFITESTEALHPKKKQKTIQSVNVFLNLLSLKKKNKYKLFTRTLKRFALVTTSPDETEQLHIDIENILRARESGHRLYKQKLYDPALYPHLAI